MAFIEIKDLTFSYNGSGANALDGVSLSVEKGDFAIVCGFSGCGKTTLLRHLKPELFPNGSRRFLLFILLLHCRLSHPPREMTYVFRPPAPN